MDFVIVVAIGVLNSIATLIIVAIGLSIIFGMMRIINLAQGEFFMMGAYALLVYTRLNMSIWIAMLLASLTVAVIGVVLERAVIRFFYGRIQDTLLATWGLSLALIGIITLVFGPTPEGIGTPLGYIKVGKHNITAYEIFVIFAAPVLLGLTYLFLYCSRYGMTARATMQNPTMAAAVGVNTQLVYMPTFGCGAGLAGLAGAIMAPLVGVVPTMGLAFIAEIFITVVVGGPAVLLGTTSASVVLGIVERGVSYASTPLLGEVALLLAAILLLRVMPEGISGSWRRGV